MTDPTEQFYDDLSGDYHRIYRDWWSSVQRQGAALDRVMKKRLGPEPQRVLDCTAGIGTQALGLCVRGHHVVATDLSEGALARARAEAGSRSLELTARRWDVRRIGALPEGPFDVVLSGDNSLPHLVDPGDLDRATAGMWSKVDTPGLLIVTIRDYDAVLSDRPRFQGPWLLDETDDRRIVMQFWDWHPTEPTYELHHIMHSLSDGRWETSVRSCRYRALARDELEASVRAAGASDLEWLESDESGFFQPMLVASKAP